MEITVTCGAAEESDESKLQGGDAPETTRRDLNPEKGRFGSTPSSSHQARYSSMER